MRRIIVSLSFVAACASTARAQEPMALSLQAAMDYAVKNNVNAKNARIDVGIQDAQNRQVTAIALPQVNAKGEFTEFFNIQKAFLPGEFLGGAPGTFVPVAFTPKYSTTASATASQLLFDGSALVALQARRSVLELMNQRAQLTEEMIRYNVQNAYYSLVIGRRQLSIIKNSLVSLREMEYYFTKQKEGGFVEKIEVDRITVQVNNLSTDSLNIDGMLRVSEQSLKYAMGMDVNTPVILTDTSVEQTLEKGLATINANVDYNNRTDYNLLLTNQKLNEYNLKRYKFAALPSLAIVGSLGYNYGSSFFSQMIEFRKYYQFYSFGGLQLNVPIFSGLKRRNQVIEAKLNIDKTKNEIEFQKQSIDYELETSRTTLKNAILQMRKQEDNLTLAKGVVDLARKKYNAGVGSSLEVNQAQTELLQSQNRYFTTLLTTVMAQTSLQKALGNFK
jgi:outer membrane protein